MRTFEIPCGEWRRTLDEFSMVHAGWPVSLDVLAPSVGKHRQIRNLPLLGVSAETSDAGTAVRIAAARLDGDYIAHTIDSPTRVRIERTREGVDCALLVDSADGGTAVLRIKVPFQSHYADPGRGIEEAQSFGLRGDADVAADLRSDDEVYQSLKSGDAADYGASEDETGREEPRGRRPGAPRGAKTRFETLDETPGPSPEIRCDGGSNTFHFGMRDTVPNTQLVIRIDSAGRVWARIAADTRRRG